MPGVSGEAALTVASLSKTFPGQRALIDVDLEVRRGEIHALIGQNGSGKSTVVKIIAGYHRPDDGARATIAGTPLELGSTSAAVAAGIRIVHQDLGLIETLSVADNFRLNRPLPALRPLRRRDERAAARDALRVLGYDVDPTAIIADLSESERTAVAVARALDAEDRGGEPFPLLILDEATAALPGPEVDRLFSALRRVVADGTAILFISHHLDEVLQLADRVTVLRDGRRITTREVAGLTHEALAELMLGRQLFAEAPAHTRHVDAASDHTPVLSARRIAGRELAPLDLDVAAGEVVGVAGLTGSGRDELAGLLSGRLDRSGDVYVDGRIVASGDPRVAIGVGLCCVPADRANDALMLLATMRENLTLADLAPFWARGRLSTRAERGDTSVWVERLDIRPPTPEAIIGELSGGNQQKTVLARWLRVSPRVLVLDEPTQGVDVGSKADIHRLVDEAAGRGAATVVCSSDSAELERLCSEVIVLQRGRVLARLTGDDINEERIEEIQLLPLSDVVDAGAPTS